MRTKEEKKGGEKRRGKKEGETKEGKKREVVSYRDPLRSMIFCTEN